MVGSGAGSPSGGTDDGAAARERDRAADDRDSAADDRDHAGNDRDDVANERDRIGNRRDLVADQRDRRAEARDRAAEESEQGVSPSLEPAGAIADAISARRAAASDRGRAVDDRRAGAGERAHGKGDRASSRNDRRAAATDRKSASIDELTGAYLRSAGLTELRREIERAKRTDQPLVVAFVDVDHLKALNDSQGHAAGDRMLARVARTLRSRLRPYDLIIRYGGDEFLCAVSGVSIEEAQDRMHSANPSLLESPEGGSVSFGLAQLGPAGSLEDTIGRADTALYEARAFRRFPADHDD